MAETKRKWIQSAIRKPGAVKNAAKRHGKSVTEEARAESHSPDKKIAARGRLALRFKGKAKHGNIRKKRTHKGRGGKMRHSSTRR